MDTILFILFITLSYNHLGSVRLTEAEKPIDGLTIDLIHRYSPKSPFYNSSMTLQERYQSLAHHSSSRHRRLKRLKNNNFATDIIPSNGDYLIKISVGVPPVALHVIADTGSDLIWVRCQGCEHCESQNKLTFNPNKSSTYQRVACDSPFCPDVPEMQCNSTSNECQYWYTYGNGSSLTSGTLANDWFTFASTDAQVDELRSPIIFGCDFVDDGQFDPDASGFLGLSGGRFSLLSQLGISNRFSYCLTPSGSTSTSKLRLGSHVTSNLDAVTTLMSTRYLPSFYVINLKGISIGQKIMRMDRDIFIDSSSTLTYIDPTVYSRLERAVKEAVVVQPMPKPPQQGVSLCYDKNSGPIDPLKMVIHLNEGDIVLNSKNIFMDLGESVCLAIVPSEEDGDPMILGNVAQVNFELEYDLQRNTVSFTPKSCVD